MLATLYRWLNQAAPPAEAAGMDADTVRAIPANFFRYVGSLFLTKLGDALVNPKTTLVWISSALGAPAWVGGLLVPIRESGSMILQFALAAVVQSFERRKWVWVIGAAGQLLAVLAIAAVAFFLEGLSAGLALLGAVALFSLARSLCSLSAKDVLGRTQPRERRGRASGWASSAAGVVTVVAALAAWRYTPRDMGVEGYIVLLLAAASLWLLAALLFATLAEPRANSEADKEASPISLIISDSLLQRFILVRALLMCSALSGPFYVLLAQRASGSSVQSLALFVGLGGVAALLAGPIWGFLSDQSSRWVMISCSTAAALLALGVVGVNESDASNATLTWLLPAAYFLLSVIHEGVRISRKTYIVDIAQGNRRTDYIAASNSAIGVLLLLIGGITAAVGEYSVPGALVLLAVMGLAGALLGLSLPEVETVE
jgi:MFS family permease